MSCCLKSHRGLTRACFCRHLRVAVCLLAQNANTRRVTIIHTPHGYSWGGSAAPQLVVTAGEIVCPDRWLVGVPVGEPSVLLGKVSASCERWWRFIYAEIRIDMEAWDCENERPRLCRQSIPEVRCRSSFEQMFLCCVWRCRGYRAALKPCWMVLVLLKSFWMQLWQQLQDRCSVTVSLLFSLMRGAFSFCVNRGFRRKH